MYQYHKDRKPVVRGGDLQALRRGRLDLGARLPLNVAPALSQKEVTTSIASLSSCSYVVESKTHASSSQAQIGFFLHIPFPTSEIFRTLPVREDLLRGVLNSDLVGFHTPDYLNHVSIPSTLFFLLVVWPRHQFSSSCVQLLGTQTTPISITWDARNVSIGVFPVGIEPEKFLDGLQTDAIKEEIQKLQKSLGVDSGKKVLLGVDRLDYIKGFL